MKDFYPTPQNVTQEFIDAIEREGFLSAPRTKTNAEILEDLRIDVSEAHRFGYAPPPRLPTYEEIGAYLHRAVNPTPADRAAAMLNGEPRSPVKARYPGMSL